tara:strand:- start:115 stop:273 length:159 start_codon:yes stop_codon:yes gene_type:complete
MRFNCKDLKMLLTATEQYLADIEYDDVAWREFASLKQKVRAYADQEVWNCEI